MNPMVEGLRGLAALLVVWAHWAVPLGWPGALGAFAFTGVDLFFVLSGYVFAPALLGAKFSIAAFALRRLMRIYPAYLLALAVYVALAWHGGKALLYLPEHVLMLHLQSREMTFYYNPVFWSLPSEVEFYLLLPCLAWAIRRGGLRVWAACLVFALVLRLLLMYQADWATQNHAYLAIHHLPGLLVEFFFGVLVYQHARAGTATRVAPWLWVTAGGLVWSALATLFVWLEASSSTKGWVNGQLSLGAALAFALMLRGLESLRPSGAWKIFFLTWLGRLSYGVYLLHTAWLGPAQWLSGQVGVFWASLMALGALLMSAWLLHVTWEEPARRLGRIWARKLCSEPTMG
jgi:peptidoglycan/LPS O-acetylase OafA/YrhL